MNRDFDKAVHEALRFIDAEIESHKSALVEEEERYPGCAYTRRGMIRDREALRAALLEAYDEQKAEERRGGWIACSERMPEDNVAVLFVRRSPSGMFSIEQGPRRHSGHDWLWGYDFDWGDSEVTHWQPLPAVPMTNDAADAPRMESDK